jgi:hypothetical protein
MAQIVSGQVGPVLSGDGVSAIPLRQGKLGDVIVSELHGRFYEQAYRGNIYSGGMQLTSISNATFALATATSQTLATAATATPILGIYNPLASKVNAVVAQAIVSAINTALQTTGPGSLVWLVWTGQNAITTGATPWSRNTLQQAGSQVKNLAGVALTGLSTVQPATTSVFATSSLSSGPMSNVSTLQTAAGLMPTQATGNVENFDGSVVIPPGGVFALFASGTAVAVSAATSMMWEEVSV